MNNAAWNCCSTLLQGHKSEEIPEILGYAGSEEVMHRDNISMVTIRNPGNSAEAQPPPYAVLNDLNQNNIEILSIKKSAILPVGTSEAHDHTDDIIQTV